METPSGPPQQANYANYMNVQEENNLRALAIGCLVYGGFVLVMVAFQAAIMRPMMQMMFDPKMFRGQSAPPPDFKSFMQMVQTMMICMYAFLGISGLLSLWAAKCIFDRKNWIIPMIAAGLACIYVPIGTVLGVFIFILLSKPTVRARFTS